MKLNNTDCVRTAVRKTENGYIIEVWSSPYDGQKGIEYVAKNDADLSAVLAGIFQAQRLAILGFFDAKSDPLFAAGGGGNNAAEETVGLRVHYTPACNRLMGYGLDGVVEK